MVGWEGIEPPLGTPINLRKNKGNKRWEEEEEKAASPAGYSYLCH